MSTANPMRDEQFQDQVIQAAKLLFQQHGLRKVTMDDVAKAVGKGRSSLYYYYKSKEEIFGAVVDAEINEMLAAMALAARQADTVEQKIYAFCAAKLHRKKRSLYNSMEAGMDAEEMSNFNKARNAIHKRIMTQESGLLGQILEEGIKKGELRDPGPLDDIIFVLLTSLHGLKREMVIDNDFERIGPVVETLTRMVIHGLKK